MKSIDIFCERCGEGLDGSIEIDAKNDVIIVRVEACPPCMWKARRLDDVIDRCEEAIEYCECQIKSIPVGETPYARAALYNIEAILKLAKGETNGSSS